MARTTPFKRPEIAPPPDIEAASLRSDRFRLEREVDWQRLERIVVALEKNRPGRIGDDDLLELPVLYRKAASSLAVLRETSLDAATRDYLESLVRRAWFQVYGPRIGLIGWLRRFLGGGWSAAVRAIWLEICIAAAIMVAGAVVGWVLVAQNPDWYYSLVPGALAGDRAPGASRAVLLATLSGTHGDTNGLGLFATYLFSNNTSVCIMAFSLGFAFGIPTILLLVQNMATMGALLWLFSTVGLTVNLAAWLSVHGTTELSAILLSGAAGLHVGRSMAFPGDRSVLAAAAESGRRAAQVMAGCTLMLVVAGLLEGFVRQLVVATPARFAVGATMLVFWVCYFTLVKGSGEPAGNDRR